jgi:hypothetical protein
MDQSCPDILHVGQIAHASINPFSARCPLRIPLETHIFTLMKKAKNIVKRLAGRKSSSVSNPQPSSSSTVVSTSQGGPEASSLQSTSPRVAQEVANEQSPSAAPPIPQTQGVQPETSGPNVALESRSDSPTPTSVIKSFRAREFLRNKSN